MKRRLNLIIYLSAAVLMIAACDPNPAAPDPGTEKPLSETVSSVPGLLDFSLEGIAAKAVIQEDGTVVLTVPPMEISKMKPEVKVPEGVTYAGLPETLVDGKSFDLTLTGKNDASSKWKVTINVEPGLAFTLDGQCHVLKSGILHSEDPVENAAAGAGVPICRYDAERDVLLCAAFSENADLAENPYRYANFNISRPYDEEKYIMRFYDSTIGYFDIGTEPIVKDEYCLYTTDKKAKYIIGSFSGDSADEDDKTHTLENGFFKFLQLSGSGKYPEQAPN